MIKCTNVWKEGLLESHFGCNYQNNERNVLQTRLTENPLWLLATTECVGHVAPSMFKHAVIPSFILFPLKVAEE